MGGPGVDWAGPRRVGKHLFDRTRWGLQGSRVSAAVSVRCLDASSLVGAEVRRVAGTGGETTTRSPGWSNSNSGSGSLRRVRASGWQSFSKGGGPRAAGLGEARSGSAHGRVPHRPLGQSHAAGLAELAVVQFGQCHNLGDVLGGAEALLRERWVAADGQHDHVAEVARLLLEAARRGPPPGRCRG